MVAVPNLVVSIYFGLIASDQYVSEAKFTVSSGAIPKMDELGSVTGVPPILIVQDTQVVTSYIHSRAMVEQLERTVGLRDALWFEIDRLVGAFPQRQADREIHRLLGKDVRRVDRVSVRHRNIDGARL